MPLFDTGLCNIIISFYSVISGSKTIQERHIPFDRMENEVDGEFAGDGHYFLKLSLEFPSILDVHPSIEPKSSQLFSSLYFIQHSFYDCTAKTSSVYACFLSPGIPRWVLLASSVEKSLPSRT